MDASKLRNILFDLAPEPKDEINSNLENLSAGILSSDTKKIKGNISSLEDAFNDSIINYYTPSNLAILETIGAKDFFGSSGYEKIRSILDKNPYNVNETSRELDEYISDRKSFLELVDVTNKNLKKLNIEAHYSNEDYEVGLLMPTSLTGNKIVKITKELNHWDKLLKTFKELVGEPIEDTEINFLNNGSLQFFIDNSPHIAIGLSFAIERIVNVYIKLRNIRETKDTLEKLGGLPKADKKIVEKNEKQILNKEIDKITQEIIKNFASKEIESGRLNEIKIAVKGHVIYMAKCIDDGMVIEINPPEVDEPEAPKETDTDEEQQVGKQKKINYEAALKNIEAVDKAMKALKSIGKTGIDVVKYLTDGAESEDEPKADDEEENTETEDAE